MLSVRCRSALSLLLSIIVVCALLPCAFADDQDTSTEPRWASAEAAIQDLIAEYEADESCIALAYYNTVTGEEYYLNPDQYMDAASMYKVPLNMIFAERVANGELDPDGNIGLIPYTTLRDETLINSDNEKAADLIAQFNGYHNFRVAIAPYMGVDPDNADAKYYENNFFTPRQMLTCLKLLYTEQDRFPGIIETMSKAEPDNYFCRDEHRYTIAHKYGWNEENGILSVNDCAIIPTKDPIIIVLFTTSCVNRQLDFLTAFCTRCIDYTESVTAAREANEAAEREAKETAAKEAEAEAQKAEAEAQAEALIEQAQNSETSPASADRQTANNTAADAGDGSARRAMVLLGALAFVCVASVIFSVLRLRERKYGFMLVWFELAVVAIIALIFAWHTLL